MKVFWRYKLDHLLFWMAVILFHFFLKIFLIGKAGAFHFFVEIFLRNALLAAVCYFNILYLFPRFFKKDHYLFYTVAVLLCLAFYTAFKNLHDIWLYGYIIGDPGKRNFFFNTYYNFSTALFYVAFTLALELSKKWYTQQQLLQKIQIENLNTELQYLKAQINPHFLFNSLNTIHFQIDKHNSEARESLEKFSAMLRYQLYECNTETVPVEKEIEYLHNYTDMQRLRKNKSCHIEFNCTPDVHNFSIAPLLLMPFTENAFKYVSYQSTTENYVKINIDMQQQYFTFNVINTKEAAPPAETNGGIGLKNVQRRLQLLYNGRHELCINDTPATFSITLKLQLP